MIRITLDEVIGTLSHHSQHYAQFGEWMLPRPGTIDFETREPEKYLDALRTLEPAEFLLVLPEHEMKFVGVVTEVTFPGIIWETAKVSIRLIRRAEMKTRTVDVTKHGAPEAVTPKTHRFYVASPGAFMNTERTVGRSPVDTTSKPWAKKTLDDATAHAQQLLEEDPKKDEVVIVKVVRIVKRKKLPIKIEDVR